MDIHAGEDQIQKLERVRMAAYMIWQEEGRPEGHALAHWLRALELVEAQDDLAQDVMASQNGEAQRPAAAAHRH